MNSVVNVHSLSNQWLTTPGFQIHLATVVLYTRSSDGSIPRVKHQESFIDRPCQTIHDMTKDKIKQRLICFYAYHWLLGLAVFYLQTDLTTLKTPCKCFVVCEHRHQTAIWVATACASVLSVATHLTVCQQKEENSWLKIMFCAISRQPWNHHPSKY
jgi:hypothetical protein